MCTTFPSHFPMVPCASMTPRTTGAALAESISKSLAKKAVAYALDGTVRDLSDPLGKSGKHRDRHPRRPARAGADPPRHGPRAGRGRAGTVARHAGDDRPGHRERLLLRLRRATSRSRPRTSRSSRRRCARSSSATSPSPRRSGRATRPSRCFADKGEALQGRADRRHSRRPGPEDLLRRATGSTSAAGRTWPRPARSATPSS